MIEFKKITIQNFLSFGHKPITIQLNEHDTTLILGVNKDVGTEGYSRNGVGKSTIFQAISWVLFNEGISNIRQDAFVNVINKKKMVVEIEMVVDDIEFVIRRGRKPAVCEVLKDGEPYTMHSAATVDETIEKLIGINFDTFCNTIMLNTTTIPFMGMKPSPQRDFMEKMVGLDVLSERANTLKSKNKDVIVEIKLEEQNKSHIISNFDKVTARIESLDAQSKSWNQSHMDEVKDTETEIEGLSLIDVEATQKTNQIIRDQIEAIKKIKQFESDSSDKSIDLITKKSNLEKSLIEKKALLKESLAYLTDNAKQLRVMVDSEEKLRGELKNLMDGICPYCKQTHVDNDKIDLINSELQHIDEDAIEVGKNNESVGAGVHDLKAEISTAEDELTELTKLTDNIHSELNKLLVVSQREQGDKQRELEGKLEDELLKITADTNKEKESLNEEYDASVTSIGVDANESKISYEVEVGNLSTSLPKEVYTDAECIEIISTLKNLRKQLIKVNEETNPYVDQLIRSKAELVEYDESVLFNLKEKESHYKLLIKMLTDNKSFIRKNLLDQYIPYINQKIAEYTMKLELPHIVTINNDLTVDIDYMQNSVSYGNLSNGERGRLDFSVSMAFRDLMSVSGFKFNFLGIDELLDNGIDASGFHAIFKLLKEHKNENVFLISHRDDLVTEVDNIMKVVKENGFTHII